MFDAYINNQILETKNALLSYWLDQKTTRELLGGYEWFAGGDTVASYSPYSKLAKKLTIYVLDIKDVEAFDWKFSNTGYQKVEEPPQGSYLARYTVADRIDIIAVEQTSRKEVVDRLPFLHQKATVEFGTNMANTTLYVSPAAAQAIYNRFLIADKDVFKNFSKTRIKNYTEEMIKNGWAISVPGSMNANGFVLEQYMKQNKNGLVP